MAEFNVMQHTLVPEHHLVPKEEEKELLAKFKIEKDQLPKIRKSDPCIKVLESLMGPISEGRIVKIVRKSETAGVSVAYRLVVRE